MIISGYLPLSLCDYPGKIAAMVFTQGCNFNCPWCHNRHLLPEQSSTETLDPEWILNELSNRKAKGLIQAIAISGGEPTLQHDLIDFLRQCRATGLLVKLDTNGSNPDVIQACFNEQLIDFIAMDIKAPWDKYPTLVGGSCDVDAIHTTCMLIANSGIEHQFRTTRVDPLLTEADYTTIAAQIPHGSPHVWQTYRPVASR